MDKHKSWTVPYMINSQRRFGGLFTSALSLGVSKQTLGSELAYIKWNCINKWNCIKDSEGFVKLHLTAGGAAKPLRDDE